MTTTTDKEPMKVFLRIRPFLKNEEINKENQGCIQIKGGHQIELVPPEDSFVFKSGQRIISDQSNEFTFTKVFNEETTQKDFFDGTMLSFVEDILDGQNGLVFSYGVTNSGKTYTIQGKPSNGGVLPRSLDVIFNSIGKKLHSRNNMKPTLCQDVAYLNDDEEGKEESLKRKILNALQNDDTYGSLFNSTSNSTNIEDISRVSDTNRLERLSAVEEEIRQRVTDNTSLCLNNKQGGNATYAVWISFMEIYNEFIYDLLDPQLIVRGKKRQNLKLGDDKRGNPYVKDLKHVMVTSSDEAYKVLRLGQGNRHMAATKLNQASSRSHSIFTIKILKIENNDHVTRVSRLSIVDLAGSERYCKTQAGNNRLKEASNINSSIMTLGQCINALRYNQTHPSQTIVPFRESKLTRLFQSFFLGKGKTAMIVNISQCASVFDETMNVMRFSAVAKHVKTKAGRTTELYKVVEKLPPPLSTPLSTPSRQRLTRPFIATPAATPSGNSKRTLNDPTAFSYDELVSIVGELRDKVKKERVEKLQMESKLRKEIGSDFNKLCEQMGRDHQERLSEQKDRLETLMEKRLENMSKLVETLHKNDQRDRDEQFVSVAQYENERIKVQTRDATIRDLKERMDKFQPRDLLNDSSTAVEVERLETELGEAQRKLSEARDCLAMHMKEMERMQQKLQDKDDEIERLLDEQQVSQEEKDDSIKDADHDKSKLIEELKGMLARVTEELENHRKEAQEQAEKTNQTFSAHESLKADHEDLIKIAEKHKEWYVMMKEKNALITSEKAEFERLYQESEAKLKEVTTKWEGVENGSRELKESVQTMQFENDENAIKVERYEALVKEHRSALADSEAIVEQLNKEKEANEQTIAQLKTDLEVKTVEYERYAEEKCDFEATINSLHQQVDKLREEADKNLNNQKQVTDELYNELERKNEDFKKLLQDKVVLVEQLNIDLDAKNKEIEKLIKEKAIVDELNIDLENKKQEVEDLTKEKTNMDATVVQLRSEMEELRQLSLKNPPMTESKPVMLERQQQQISDVVSMEALRAKLTPKKTPMKNMTPKKTPIRVMTPLRQATPTTTPRSRLNNEASTSKMNTLLRETATALEAKTSRVYELEAKLKDVESKISKSKVESQLSELKTRCTDLTAEIATEKSKYQSLLTELNSEKENVTANEKLHEGKVKSLTAELREAKQKLELIEESSEKMLLQLQRATEENEKFREKERSVRKELEERRKSRFVFEQTTSSCIEELKEDSNQIKKSMFKETAKLEEENVELAHELLEVKKLNDQLEIELTREKSSHEKCQSDIKQLQTELQLAETLKNKLKMRTENLEYRLESMEKEKNLKNQNQLESVASQLAESKRNHTQVVQQLKEAAEKISKQDTNIQIHLEKILLLEEQLKSTTTTSGEEDKENRASRSKRRVTRQNSQCDDEDEEAVPTKKSKAKATPKKKYGLRITRSKPSSNLQEPVIDDDSLEESMVLVTSIACSPVREELTNHIAVGEVVAVRCDDVAEQPLLGEVAGKAGDTLSLRVMTGGYTRVWRVKPNEEARDFSVHDIILTGIRLLNSRRLPAEVKHSLQSLYDTQN